MRCKHCDGTGYNDTQRGTVMTEYPPCPWCGGSGYVKDKKQTRFEFMQSCTMEELGCFICEKLMNGACGKCKFMKPINGRHTCGLREWLKQPHTIKE